MNIPPDNFLAHYNSIDYGMSKFDLIPSDYIVLADTTRMPLVDPQSPDLFDCKLII